MSMFKSQLFRDAPIVGILRNIVWDDLMEILPLYQKAGLTTIEITMNTADAPRMIRSSIEKYGHALNIGAGTVCCMDDLEAALASNAQFVVAPNVDAEVIQTCVSKNVPVFPGAYTPTEIYRAWHLGASMVKIFPARSLGVDYIKDILAPLNQVECMATGGIGIKDIPAYRNAGVKAFGIGIPLFPPDLIARKEWGALERNMREFAQVIQERN